MTLRASITAFTHPGLDRPNNQDAVGIGAWFGEGTLWQPWRTQLAVERPLLCVIADGMGGHAAGEVASADVVRHLLDTAQGWENKGDVARSLGEADDGLHHRAAREPALAGMGTTVVGLLLMRNRLIWFNVGDSRLYRYREGFLRQVSIDDVPSGDATAGPHRRSHIVSASLGGRERNGFHPHIGEEPAVPSRWLLCSDGVSDMVDTAQIEAAMAGTDLEAWAGLFAGIMEAGARDNFSIILVTIEVDDEQGARNGP